MESDSSSDADDAASAFPGSERTRRRFLRSAVNVGAGAGLVRVAGADHASRRRGVPIVYARARTAPGANSYEERTKRVPGDWYDSLQTAFDVQRRIRESDLASILGSFVIPGTYDDPTPSLSVSAAEGTGDQIADLVEAVPVDVDVINDLPPLPEEETPAGAPFQVTDLDDRRVPGGVDCLTDEANGTLAPALFDAESGERFFATANHVYRGPGELVTEHRGEPFYLPRDDDRRLVGRVDRGYPVADIVRVTPEEEYVPTSEIERATPSTVIGQFTRAGLADLMARGEALHKFGARSGHTKGTILGVDGITCYTADLCRTGQLKWGSEEAIVGGDSGSVNYRPDPENPDDYLLVGGINNARTWWPGADYTWGTAAYELLAEHGLHF